MKEPLVKKVYTCCKNFRKLISDDLYGIHITACSFKERRNCDGKEKGDSFCKPITITITEGHKRNTEFD